MTNVIDLTNADRPTAPERGELWTDSQILMFISGSMARRIADPIVAPATVHWGVSDEGDAFFTAFVGDVPQRHFEVSDCKQHKKRCVRAIVLYGAEGVDLFSDGEDVSGTSVRGVLRSYMSSEHYRLMRIVQEHHRAHASKIVRLFERADFSFKITSDVDDVDAFPLFDWDFITEMRESYQGNQLKTVDKVGQAVGFSNVVTLPNEGTTDG